MCQGYGRRVALAGKEVSCQWSVSGTCSSPTRIAGGTQILIFTTVAAKAVKGRFSTVNFKAVGSLNIAHQSFSLLTFHVEDFTAFGAGKMDMIFAGRIVTELVERFVTAGLCYPLDFLLGLKLSYIAVDGAFADIFARQSLRDLLC